MRLSLAPCVGHYDLPGGIVLSVPVTFTDGKWSVLLDVTVGDELKERLQLSASEIRRVRQGTEITGVCSSNMLYIYIYKYVILLRY